MTGPTAWTGTEALPKGQTLLLEASAGTGKTWQIEGLVVRLVAEYGISVDRILVITFTNAATSELRDRIRQRIREARDALGRTDAPSGDPILEALWSARSHTHARRERLSRALSSFDLAPISTIHGFSQRMLDQLAFESGQEPGLELLADPTAIVQRLVDDQLARVFAVADEQELELLADMGWSRGSLARLAWAMAKAVEPVVEPEVDLDADAGPLGPLATWRAAREQHRSWLASAEGRASVASVTEELERRKGKRTRGMRRRVVGEDLDTLTDWLAGPAPRSGRTSGSGMATWARNLCSDALAERWIGTSEQLAGFEGRALFERTSVLFELQDGLWPQPLAAFAARVRRQVDAELVRAGQLTYSTMLSRLAERIEAQGGGEGPLARAIRSRFDVALVDEFQDTDGAQWPVMRAVFAHPSRRLVIIGDPKQAIYAFRGADVHVYLDAARVASARATMRTNWRSDGAFIQAMNHLWYEGSGAFGLEDVDYVEVGWPARDLHLRVRGLPAVGDRDRCPFELRWVDGQTVGSPQRVVGSKEVGQDATARLAAQEAARLLAGRTELAVEGTGEPGTRWRGLAPGDIAVLVRTNSQAERVRKHLDQLGIPCVSAGRGSVLDSPVLDWLCSWLDAVADPGRDRPARALATTPLFGWTALDLATALAAADAAAQGELTEPQQEASDRWAEWLRAIREQADGWRSRGFVRVFERVLDDFDVVRRLLGARQGERYATDLRHLVELCHAEERRTRIGPSGLAAWLRSARDATGDGADEAQALRLESDAHAVQLVTIHKSKGLEYPVVLLPFGWADFQPRDGGGPLEWHARRGDRTEIRLNLEAPGTGRRAQAAEQAARETRQEQLRLLYVALTRARHHCVAWLGPLGQAGAKTDSHALGRIVLRQRDEAGRPAEEPDCPSFPSSTSRKPDVQQSMAEARAASWEEVQERLDLLAATSQGTIGWSHEPPMTTVEPLAPQGGSTGALEARPWRSDRRLVSPWRVSSYSALVAGRTFDASEPQRLEAVPVEGERTPEQETGARVGLSEPAATATGLDAPIDTAELQGGTEAGTWAHAVLENLDFQRCVGHDGRDLPTLLADLGARHGIRAPRQQELLAGALPAILDTPLDGGRSRLTPGFSLRGLQPADRLDELGFDLRLGDGNRWRRSSGPDPGRLNPEGARLALQSRLGAPDWGGDEWLRALLDRADHDGRGVLPRMVGILTGFIDLTLRTQVSEPDGSTRQRYFVSDYKTNRIGSPGRRRDSRRRHYTQPWMAWEMAHHGYHLQALLYTVALHRMLGQRLPGYAYERDVGGHLYLFLRGMTGPQTPRDAGLALGVYFDRWPARVVLGLDAALSGASTQEVGDIVDAAGGDR